MPNKKDDKQEETGFIIIDKRIGAKKSQEGEKSEEKKAEKTAQEDEGNKGQKEGIELNEEKSQKEEKTKEKTSDKTTPLPEVDFASLILSLSTSVYIHLGELPDPATNEKNINIPLAKQTIDIIALLKQKTEGNRTKEEDKLINEILYSLRMNFVSALSNSNS